MTEETPKIQPLSVRVEIDVPEVLRDRIHNLAKRDRVSAAQAYRNLLLAAARAAEGGRPMELGGRLPL